MNFIYDQEERINQLENYMQDITDEFMEFSSEVALRLKERIKENESRPRKIEKITKKEHDLSPMERFNVGNTKVVSIRDPRVKLAHRCIATTIVARKETTHRIIEIDLYYLYCIYTLEVACNIPFCLAKYFNGMREKILIYGGMLVTNIARVMAEEEEDDVDDEGVRGDAGHGEAKGSTDLYNNMSQGDWTTTLREDPIKRRIRKDGTKHQHASNLGSRPTKAHWMGQQDERWGRLDTWMGQ
ncbi:hypothetical protein Tco_1093750 [Tanacetum coccineum]|uniref:Uncharacterized protein n=1 Tax=Tanacetum coccineum TaxID=301880 RepID=A0ABQ5IFM7_9ASTR